MIPPETQTTVLIIDDDPSFRLLMVHQVKRAGFITLQAGDVKSALQILQEQPVQLVLTDVHLPDGNGVELVRMIKAAYPLIEIIAITSLGRIADGVLAIKNGAFDYLEKGVDDLRLIELLNTAAENVRLQNRLHQLQKEVEQHTIEAGKPDIISQNRAQIDKASLIIKALHSPIRQGIMQFLFVKGQANVTEIHTTLGMEQAIASQHLLILKDAGLVKWERIGKSNFYSANYPGIEKIITFVQQLLGKD